jgi:hypothetical protein
MASKNAPAVPRRRYADFCNKIGQQETHAPQQLWTSFDYLVGTAEQREWDCDAEGLGGFQVYG